MMALSAAGTPICDGCRLAPPAHRDACTLPVPSTANASCDERQCAWLMDSKITLGVIWGGGHGATRGWGNSFTYLRNLHEVAAVLGRRLLVHPQRAFLPTHHVYLGGRLPWGLGSPEEYLNRPGAVAVSEEQARTAVLGPGGSFKGLEHVPNRTAYKYEFLRFLDTLHGHPHVWLNLSKSAMYILTKYSPCPTVRHAKPFTDCMARLITTPIGALSERHAALRSKTIALGVVPQRTKEQNPAGKQRLGSSSGDASSSERKSALAAAPGSWTVPDGRYIAVHIRTFASDKGVPPGTSPNTISALGFYAWEVEANASDYAANIRKLCRPGSLPIYVASDARAAILLFEELCPGRVVHQYSAEGLRASQNSRDRAATTHSENLRGVAASRASSNVTGGGGLMLDWLMLSSAYAIVRWGAQHSSFATSAATRSCGARLWRSPKTWHYKAATSWLLGKLHFHARVARGNATYDCDSRIRHMLLDIKPCLGGCVSTCIAEANKAFA